MNEKKTLEQVLMEHGIYEYDTRMLTAINAYNSQLSPVGEDVEQAAYDYLTNSWGANSEWLRDNRKSMPNSFDADFDLFVDAYKLGQASQQSINSVNKESLHTELYTSQAVDKGESTSMAHCLKEYIGSTPIEQIKEEWAEIEKQFPSPTEASIMADERAKVIGEVSAILYEADLSEKEYKRLLQQLTK